MKRMKKIKSRFVFLSVGCVTLLSACGKFEDINTNVQGVSQEMLLRDGVQSGGYIQTLEKSIIPVGTAANSTSIINQYQIAFNIGQDTWSGYFSQNADWNGGNNHSTYNFAQNGWIGATFTSEYTSSFAPWLAIKNQFEAGGSAEAYALAQILKISAWHQSADTFGPIPYTQAGTGLFVTPYDPQDVVYKSMLKDLKDAVDALTEYMNKGGSSIFSDYDYIYSGKVENWIKYGNSLMLRLAMRIRFAEPAIAKEYAEAAVSHSVGIMKEVADGATIGKALGLQFINPIQTLAVSYSEARMGASMMAYLGGYEDPRITKYFLPSKKSTAIVLPWLDGSDNAFLPIAPGNTYRDKYDKASSSDGPTSLPNIEDNTPVRILLASEVYFLRAEGALVGWNMGGDAKQLYEEGIRISFEENGLKSDEANTYMSGESAPMEVDLSRIPSVGRVLSVATDETVKFEGSDEQKLQKIITQKWIAIYPNGQEAWTEWRRTGYPVLIPVIHNNSNGIIPTATGVRRMPYYSPSARSTEEQAAYDKAVELLGGPDNGATKLWWDKK
jgi:hypothetical protein